MHIVHVTPHLPPDQAANALLPWQLGEWARSAGDTVEYVAHPPRTAAVAPAPLAGGATWVPRRTDSFFDRGLRLGSLTGAYRVRQAMAGPLQRADLVHVHSNGLLPELGVLLARRAGKPVVLTLYGTEIWHYRPRKRAIDLFTRAYMAASAVTFYSARLLSRAHEVRLARRDLHVVYPPVPPAFAWHDREAQAQARVDLRVPQRHLLLNVKRLHPLAGQRYLIEAMTDVVRSHPDTRLVICGSGALLDELKGVARSAGVERHVLFPGLLDNATIARYCAAADLFVLPSLLEALPTVAVEALASGTPVLSSDNPGGLELNDLFGPDVSIVPREQPIPLGAAITRFLDDKRRTLPSTRDIVERTFRPEAVAAQYLEIYERARAEAAA
ncbi:MAG: glycosyltransferase family 4 protein [Vicinamibacterales bacterium]